MNVGVDEAGKGSIFGPVYAAAVIWNPEIHHDYLKDSKLLTKNQRNMMYEFVMENAIDFGIAYSTNIEIDSFGINKANMNAMHGAIDLISLDYDHIYVDGILFSEYKNKSSGIIAKHSCIIDGDALIPAISAASILAKVAHDRHIDCLLETNPEYFKYKIYTNKGYCTSAHVDAVKIYGKTKHHRMSFKLPFEKK